MKKRNLISVIKRRLGEDKPLIQVLLGPRQVGKTTALRAALGPDALYKNADSPVPLQPKILESWWQEALDKGKTILAIDEVQKIIAWTEVIKKLWDAKPFGLKVFLTGSSSLLMEKGLRETLAGRFELIRAEHWNYQEAERIFSQSLADFIAFGCYPGSMPLLDKDPLDKKLDRWADYIKDSIVEPALGRDLLQLHPVDQPALLRQIFGVAVALPCQIVSLQKLQGQLQGKGSLPTLKHYLDLLADAFLVTGLEKYSSSRLRVRSSSPKLIIHDNALIRAFERPLTPKLSPEKLGRYLENAVGARLLEAGWELYYWSERHLEVDFVALGPGGEKWAIEVKSQEAHESELKSLFTFCKRHPDFEPVLISLTGQKIKSAKCPNIKKILSLCRVYG